MNATSNHMPHRFALLARRSAAGALMLVGLACTTPAAPSGDTRPVRSPDAYESGVMADLPYTEKNERMLPALLWDIDRQRQQEHPVQAPTQVPARVEGTHELSTLPAQTRGRSTLLAARFTASVVAFTDAGTTPSPASARLRDAGVAHLKGSLPTGWSSATRGLGSLRIVDSGADITMNVVASAGTSVHRSGSGRADDILIYVLDADGAVDHHTLLSTAIHELGHIWCCRGEGTRAGHWTTLVADPGLVGIDRFGLMNSPVLCKTLADKSARCPSQFSDREMQALGFSSFPSRSDSPCTLESAQLEGRIGALDSQLSGMEARINEANASVLGLQSGVRNIELQYPSGIPPSVYTRYSSLVDSHNRMFRENNAQVNNYNAVVGQRSVLASRLEALAAQC